jgi:hypothetical protein
MPYPAMGPVLERLMALDGALLARPWAETVASMTAK